MFFHFLNFIAADESPWIQWEANQDDLQINESVS